MYSFRTWGKSEQLGHFEGWWIGGATHEIAGAVCASTADALAVVHVVVEAHWIDLSGGRGLMDDGDGGLDASHFFAPPPSI